MHYRTDIDRPGGAKNSCPRVQPRDLIVRVPMADTLVAHGTVNNNNFSREL
jgi:hypothetical protein